MYQIDFSNPIHIHFIGIGGISMSGLAEILLTEGFTVSGSDMHRSPLTETLEQKGITVSYRQTPANLTDDIDLIVHTAAIGAGNPELSVISPFSFFSFILVLPHLLSLILPVISVQNFLYKQAYKNLSKSCEPL